MANNKGQVTPFLLMSIIIIFSGFLYFKSMDYRTKIPLQSLNTQVYEITSVKSYLNSCFKNVVVESLKMLGTQGMYKDMPENSRVVTILDWDFSQTGSSLDYSLEIMPYYLIGNEIILPSKKQIEAELEKSIKENFIDCSIRFDTYHFDINDPNERIDLIWQFLKVLGLRLFHWK